MFLKNTNLLPRHTGVFFAIVILLILLVLNFDKCYISLVDIVKKWFVPSTLNSKPTPDGRRIDVTAVPLHRAYNPVRAVPVESFQVGNSTPTVKKISVQVIPEKREATVKFEKLTDGIPAGYTLKNYLLVLAKYNKNLVQVDALNVKLSNESSVTVTTTTGATTTTAPANSSGGSICNNEGICSYVFTDLDTNDEDGNAYYYKLGVGVVYDNNGADVYSNITTYSFGTGNRQQYFRVDIDMQEQEKLLRRLADVEAASLYTSKEQKVSTDTGETISTGTDIDAYMKMLRPYIGNYPDEFTLNKQKIKDLTLDSYLDENYALGEFNVNVNLGNIMPAPTTTNPATV